LTTFPDRMQEVQARMRLGVPSMTARTRCKLGYQRRLVLLLAWLTLCPKVGPLPQISHTRAIGHYISKVRRVRDGIHGTIKATLICLVPQPLGIEVVTGAPRGDTTCRQHS
jgi:hypothetical protein